MNHKEYINITNKAQKEWTRIQSRLIRSIGLILTKFLCHALMIRDDGTKTLTCQQKNENVLPN